MATVNCCTAVPCSVQMLYTYTYTYSYKTGHYLSTQHTHTHTHTHTLQPLQPLQPRYNRVDHTPRVVCAYVSRGAHWTWWGGMCTRAVQVLRCKAVGPPPAGPCLALTGKAARSSLAPPAAASPWALAQRRLRIRTWGRREKGDEDKGREE